MFDPENIVLDGCVQWFPTAQSTSYNDECPQFEASQDSNGDVEVTFSGTMQAPTNEHHAYNPFKNYETVPYKIQISQSLGEGLKITSSIEDPDQKFGYMSVKYGSSKDEEIYGLGLQYTEWNFKGMEVHMISAEGGVGRGLQPITAYETYIMDGRIAGTSTTSYTASYTHLTNQNRAFLFNTTTLGYVDFTQKSESKIVFWHEKSVDLHLIYGKNPKDLAGSLSKKIGTMQPLPDWIMNGAIISLQGGQKEIDDRYK